MEDATARWDNVRTQFARITVSTDPSKLLSRHKNLLDEHRKFLTSLQPHCVAGDAELLHRCLEHTDTIVGDVNAIADRLSFEVRPKPSTDPEPNMSSTGVWQDTTNPISTAPASTPLKQLSSRLHTSTVVRPKRKAPCESTVESEPVQPLFSEAKHSRKKARIEDDIAIEPNSRPQAEGSQSNKSRNEEVNVTPGVNEDWFAKQVEERIRQKELSRLKKKERKRKRDSEGSDVIMADIGADEQNQRAVGNHARPQRKKKKGSQPTSEASESVSTSSAAQSRRSTPVPPRGKNRRLSPAAEYIGSILDQASDRDRMKRHKVLAV